ncbi:unnamed protein product [Medioppia subpectinata]|uniref:TraB domain-containing protein n=1 Tax=Medioppia subpectinata TaxID=1979941 RepID=A0A7R9KN05_9ACAR|nr:unnamed protein product [Medioppia subpectinata]CAG2105555.1 unnamed protein product [Medioppia subpectinata]
MIDHILEEILQHLSVKELYRLERTSAQFACCVGTALRDKRMLSVGREGLEECNITEAIARKELIRRKNYDGLSVDYKYDLMASHHALTSMLTKFPLIQDMILRRVIVDYKTIDLVIRFCPRLSRLTLISYRDMSFNRDNSFEANVRNYHQNSVTTDGSDERQLNGAVEDTAVVDNNTNEDNNAAIDGDNSIKATRGNISYEEVSDDYLDTDPDDDPEEDESESTISLDDSCRPKASAGALMGRLGGSQDNGAVDRFASEPLPETVTVLDGPNGAKLYLVGTAHFSEKSQQDVSQTILRTQPNIIVLELCESRLSILSMDEKTILEESSTMGVAKIRHNIREHGLVQGVMYALLLSLSAHLTKQLGMAPGGEFRRAFNEASKIPGCVVHLGDRPVHTTLRRAISSLTVWQKVRLAFGIIFNSESISKEEIEKCKQKDLLEQMLIEMSGEFPELSRVFLEERDAYLAYSLWLATAPIPHMDSPTGYHPAVVVGVVGIGHVAGIVKKWGTVRDEDITELLTYTIHTFLIPETSLTTKIVKKSLKYTFIGLAVWGCYRLFVPNTINTALSHASLQTIDWIQKSIHK